MPEEQYKNVINRLIYYRKNLGVSQAEMAKLLGITQSEYSKIENGQTRLLHKHLKALHGNRWDVDYIVTGRQSLCKTGGLKDILADCTAEEYAQLYVYTIENAFLYWDDIFKQQKNLCLYSELKIQLVMIANQAEQPEVLRCIRTVLGMNKKEFGELLDLTRKTYSRCEEGTSQLDTEHILKLYNNGICSPSFVIDYKHELIAGIDYELQAVDSDVRKWFYDKISNELHNIRQLKQITKT